MKITEALLAEHLVYHSLFDHVERVAPRARTLAEIRCLAALVEAMLSAHSRTEDELFIGPLEHCFEQIGQRETFHDEHTRIDTDLTRAQKATQVRKARALLLATVVLARSHFDKEERIVFPMAEKLLKSSTLNELGQLWMKQRKKPSP